MVFALNSAQMALFLCQFSTNLCVFRLSFMLFQFGFLHYEGDLLVTQLLDLINLELVIISLGNKQMPCLSFQLSNHFDHFLLCESNDFFDCSPES